MDLNLTESIRKAYSVGETLEEYAKAEGVWPEEKEIFDKYFNNVGRVLDIGCGGGRTSFYLASIRNKVTAIDLSPKLIKAAKKKALKRSGDIEFIVKDAQKLDYPDNFFDGAVFSFNGIGFIPRKKGKIKFLKEIRRVLRPKGHFFFTADNFWFLNVYFPRRIWTVIKIFFSRIFPLEVREKEYGEKYFNDRIDAPYLDVKSKRVWEEIIKQSGIKTVINNSKYGVREKRKFSLLKDLFGDGNYLFFVLRK